MARLLEAGACRAGLEHPVGGGQPRAILQGV